MTASRLVTIGHNWIRRVKAANRKIYLIAGEERGMDSYFKLNYLERSKLDLDIGERRTLSAELRINFQAHI